MIYQSKKKSSTINSNNNQKVIIIIQICHVKWIIDLTEFGFLCPKIIHPSLVCVCVCECLFVLFVFVWLICFTKKSICKQQQQQQQQFASIIKKENYVFLFQWMCFSVRLFVFVCLPGLIDFCFCFFFVNQQVLLFLCCFSCVFLNFLILHRFECWKQFSGKQRILFFFQSRIKQPKNQKPKMKSVTFFLVVVFGLLWPNKKSQTVLIIFRHFSVVIFFLITVLMMMMTIIIMMMVINNEKKGIMFFFHH